MDKHIISMRTRLPQPRKNYIIRENINDKLDRLFDCKLTVIKGGAGSGKTTLITSYFTEKDFPNVKWISLDNDCNDLFLFWDYIISALSEFVGSNEFMEYFNSGIGQDNLRSIIDILISSISEKTDIILTLDDFQYITNTAVLDSFEFLLKNASPNLHIILITRQEPPIYLAGMNMDASLLLIDDSDLRLSKKESLNFLRDTMGLDYEESTLESMSELAAGWVGGLQLITAAFRGNGENINRLRLTDRLIGDYITNEIFACLSSAQQEFLVKTSPLSYFCKDVCEYIFDCLEFDAMLESLENMLILCVDQQRGIYRYHSILAEYLRSRFQQYDSVEQLSIYEKAADAFSVLGDVDESLKHLLAAKDYNKAMELVLSLPPGARTMAYTGAVPVDAAVKNIDFAYQKFFYHYANLELDKCREIYTLTASGGINVFDGLGFLISQDSVNLAGRFIAMKEIESLNVGSVSKALILIKNATMFHYHNKYSDALDFLSKALSIPQITQNPFILYFACNIKSLVYEELGYLNQALALYLKMQELLDKNSGLKGLFPGYYIGIAGINLKQMQLDEAKRNLTAARESYQSKSNWEWFRESYDFNMAEYYLASGNSERAFEITQNLVTETSNNLLFLCSRLMRYAVKSGYMPNALLDRFTDEYEAADHISVISDSHLFYVQLFIMRKDYPKALHYLDDILACARKEHVYLRIVEALLMKLSVLLEDGENKRDVLNLCCEMIHYACDDKILLPFYYDAALISYVDAHYGKELRNLLPEKELQFYSDICKRWAKNENSILSARELEVLQELSGGYSNKEIGDHLCISLATVKTHIINIYSKLQVNSRVAAVTAARGLGLL